MHAPALLSASLSLGLRGLEGACLSQLGSFDGRVRREGIRWEEVPRRNEAGEVILLVDGMVFDVTRWLPSHPGATRSFRSRQGARTRR